jgi:hypothetical protein
VSAPQILVAEPSYLAVLPALVEVVGKPVGIAVVVGVVCTVVAAVAVEVDMQGMVVGKAPS